MTCGAAAGAAAVGGSSPERPMSTPTPSASSRHTSPTRKVMPLGGVRSSA